VNDQRKIENNEILIRSNQKLLNMNLIWSISFGVFLIVIIFMMVGFHENNPFSIILGFGSIILLNIGQFFLARSIGRLKCEIDYFKKQINEIEIKNSHPNMTRIF